MVYPLPYLYEHVFEKKHGFHDYTWSVSVTVPPTAKITIHLYTPVSEVWIEKGYEFEVDVLNKFKVWHYHDGTPQFEELLIGESELSLYYTKFEIVEDFATIVVENTDTTASHDFKCLARYRRIPREFYEKIYREV